MVEGNEGTALWLVRPPRHLWCLTVRETHSLNSIQTVPTRSPDFLFFWGKAQPRSDAHSQWHPTAYHMLDVAASAEAILDARPLALQRGARLLGVAPADCRRLLVPLIALHDIGKFAPAFQMKAPLHWPSTLGVCNPGRILGGRHTDDGYVLWHWKLARTVIERVWPGAPQTLRVLAPAIFGHHGEPVGGRMDVPLVAQRFGSVACEAALTCADAVLSLLCPEPIPTPPLDDETAQLASWWLAGLVTIADWIGSGQRWFPYAGARADDPTLGAYWEVARGAARRAVREAGLVPAHVSAARSFTDLTGIRQLASPAQQWAETVPMPDGPVLVILEDVTGAGKTEAAQMLVHRLLTNGRVSGAYWAMPTQATANAMYERQSKALAALYSESNDPPPSLILAHGQQRLHEQFRATVLDFASAHTEEKGNAGAVRGDDGEIPSTAACAAFLADDRRAALLADVGAGTVDQAILGVLPSRFNAVRLFGLSDKVLVVDEAHAYDAYMGVEVQELLRFQAALGGCAVVLSATLASKQRAALARAWAEGLHGGRRSVGAMTDGEALGGGTAPYPLATIVSQFGKREQPLEPAPWSVRSVSVRLVEHLEAALEHVLRASTLGGAVAWVRNTVDDCLDAAARLRARGVEPLVFHARFAQLDRQKREREVLALFGKGSPDERRAGRVLVATQVVEQSLDLDFDAMVSDVAPVDLLVQRAGRLQRHKARDARRPAGLPRELVVLAPAPNDDPPRNWLGGIFAGTAHVYEHAGVLWRTVRALDCARAIGTPVGLRALIESVYGSEDVPLSLLPASQRAEGREAGNSATATYATLKVTDGYDASAHAWLNDLRVPTRLGDEQTIVRLARVGSGGELTPWATDEHPAWKAWALSEVRVRRGKVPPGSVARPEYMAAVAIARAEWGRFEQELPILPLAQFAAGAWRGVLVRPGGRGDVTLRYAEDDGLAFETPVQQAQSDT